MSTVTQHIDDSLAKIRALFEEASLVLEALKPGEKVPATKLAAQIAEHHNLTGPALYPVMKFLFENYPGIEVKAGAQGGLRRLPSSTEVSDVQVSSSEPSVEAVIDNA